MGAPASLNGGNTGTNGHGQPVSTPCGVDGCSHPSVSI